MKYSSGWDIGDSFMDKVPPIQPGGGLTAGDIVNAIVNRDQIVADRQAEQVGSLMNDVKIGEVRPDLQSMALGILDRSKADLFGLYKGQKNVLKLSNENKLEAQRIKQRAMMDFSALNQVTADHKAASLHMAQLAKDGVLSQQDVQDVYNEFASGVKDATNPGDVPFLSALVNKKAGPKIAQRKKEDAIKEINTWDAPVLSQFQGKGYKVPSVDEVKDVIKAVYPGESINNYADKYKTIGMIRPGEDPVDVIARKIQAQAYPKEKPGNVYFGTGREAKEPTVIPFSNGELPLSAFNRQIPWAGKVKDPSNNNSPEYPASGNVTDIIEKPDGSLVQRIKAVYYVGDKARDIIMEKPYAGDVTAKLKKLKIDTSEIEQKFGGAKGTEKKPEKKYVWKKNGKEYSYEELEAAGVDLKQAIRSKQIIVK